MDNTDYKQKYKTYFKAISWQELEYSKSKRFYKDRRPTQAEKKFLKVREYFRFQEFDKAYALLSTVKPNCPFLEAEAELLRGTALNNKGDFQQAESHLLNGLEMFKQLNVGAYLFRSYFILFLAYLNMKVFDKLDDILDEMDAIDGKSDEDRIDYHRCRALHFSALKKFAEAHHELNQIEYLFRNTVSEMRRTYVIVTRFDIAFKEADIDECYRLLKEYQKYRVSRLSVNYKFMRNLLDHYVSDSPIYVYDRDLEASPYLLFQVNVIKSLSAGEYRQAEQWWERLRQINPDVYQPNMRYAGDFCLFSGCLEKRLSDCVCGPIDEIEGLEEFQGTMGEKLKYILEHAGGVLTKSRLIELLWSEELSDKNIARFDTLFSRTKKKFGLKVRVRKGGYRLIG